MYSRAKSSSAKSSSAKSYRALLVMLTSAGVLTSMAANAANFGPNLSIRSPGVTNSTTTIAGRGYGTPKGPPPIPQSRANDPYDNSQNLNPGGGGGGTKPSHKPSLQ